MIYNSGGPGCVMNRLYLDNFLQSIADSTCLSDPDSATVPDDLAISFCMMWHGVYPWNTRDSHGRECWHAYSPQNVFRSWEDPQDWYIKYHRGVGGVQSRLESTAPDSVAFHYISPALMYYIERSIYLCRAGDVTPEAFSHNFRPALGNKVIST
ncbi:unnamed protein product [Phytophthora fragariaefolia]|uniref:Unnamed protein product n=1 Tax=Phytophthora fragariaefolia TaxID=1490495 RepID=A0A9W6YGM3_9STRA|nr:unnamed protein product [Phytophthora fragariaefolia]